MAKSGPIGGLTEEEEIELKELQSLGSGLTPAGRDKLDVLLIKKFGLTGRGSSSSSSPREEFFEELERRVNRSFLFDLAHDGIVFNEARARAGPCECFELPSGKPFCWDKGIIGALSQDQIRTFCPPEQRIGTPGGAIPQRISQFIAASEACEKGKTFDSKVVVTLEDRLACMSKEASKRGIKI